MLLTRQPKAAALYEEAAGTVKTVRGGLSEIDNWKSEVDSFYPEAAIHMAWESIPNYDTKTSVKNLKYGLDLIEMLADIGCKSVISTGSCWEYGEQSGSLGEEMPLKPFNAFSAAKNELHCLGREIARERSMQFIWTRLFYVYGPGQKDSSLIPYIINCALKGEKPKVKTPHAKNDFIYVSDVGKAISAIVTFRHNSYEIYNIGSGYSTSVQEIIKIVCEKLNRPCEKRVPDGVNNNSYDNFWADISRVKKHLNFEPRTSIADGIDKMILSINPNQH